MSETPTPAPKPTAATPAPAELPLFPLQTVLFPGGLLQLKVFEARYLDLMSHCLRTQSPFGVVCISQGSEVHGDDQPPSLESVGVLTELQSVDAEQAGILIANCLGGARVQLSGLHQRSDGLWLAQATRCADDPAAELPPELNAVAQALGQAIGSLAAKDQYPFARPYRMDDCGWVANRWCEILPIPLAAKQRLMVLEDPVLRLKLVDEYLRGKGMV